MSTWDFFQNAMLGKKCHVDMGHVIFFPTWPFEKNPGFFSKSEILKKTHVNF